MGTSITCSICDCGVLSQMKVSKIFTFNKKEFIIEHFPIRSCDHCWIEFLDEKAENFPDIVNQVKTKLKDLSK